MRMRNRGTWAGTGTGTVAAPIAAEGATLPVIRAAGFEVRVNAYVVGRTRGAGRYSAATPNPPTAQGMDSDHDWSPGCPGGAVDLWYLSLVGARGQGTSLRALWANLVSNRAHGVWLEGVGSVALGQHRLDLAQLGYPIHWTYRQGVVAPGREVQGVLEADALTCYDPLLAPQTSPRRNRKGADADGPPGKSGNVGRLGRTGRAGRSRAEGASLTLSTQTSGATGATGDSGVDEAAAREARPLFLLLVRSHGMRPGSHAGRCELGDGAEVGEERRALVAKLHLRFLSTRIAWLPYYPPWATYLWERARERGEAERLRTWCYAPASQPNEDGTGGRGGCAPGGDGESAIATSVRDAGPVLATAYLCRPDPLSLTADLQRAIRAGVFREPAAHATDAAA